MTDVRRLVNRVVVAAAVVVALPGGLQAQKAKYVRPTTLIVPGQLSPEMKGALDKYCGDKCAGTRWANRSFSEGVHPAVPGVTVSGGKGDSTLAAASGVAAAARNLIKAQFAVGSDFSWSNDTLISRQAYSLTFDQAAQLARSNQTFGANTFGPLTNTLLFVVSDSAAPTVKEEKGKTTAEQKVRVAVLKLAYDNDRIGKDLGPLSCFPGECSNREERRRQFETYNPPLELVASFSVSASAEVEEGGREAAINALASEVVNTIIDETASAVPSFALTTNIKKVDPFAARIGLKEGVYRGHRFYAYNGEERTAVLYAKDVADNRVATFGGTAGKVVVNTADSTTFKKVYPGKVAEGTLIREKPSYISILVRPMLYNSEPSLNLEIRDEGFLASRSPIAPPFGVKTILALQYIPTEVNPGQMGSYTYVGAGAGYELYPLMGKLRIMPAVFAYYGKYDDGDEDTELEAEKKGKIALAFGADVGFRVTPEIELSFAARILGRAEQDENDPLKVVTEYGPTFGIGVRLQRGLWGAF